jgi:hypothetical protein
LVRVLVMKLNIYIIYFKLFVIDKRIKDLPL